MAVEWREWSIISVYMSPKLTSEQFEKKLEEIEEEINKRRRRKLILAGDFNAKARLWGSGKDCAKGRILCEWAAMMELRIVNRGTERTYSKGKGSSIVDLTWTRCGPDTGIGKWRVIGCETLSDHELIEFMVGKGKSVEIGNNKGQTNRWAARKLIKEELLDIIVGSTWGKESEGGKDKDPGRENIRECINRRAEKIKEVMIRACDAAMPRIKDRKRKGVA